MTQKYSGYKDSGIEWIGEIPEHWRLLRIKYFATSVKNKSEKGDEELLSVSEYYGVLPRKNIKDDSEEITRAESLVGYLIVCKGQLVCNIMLMWKRGLGVSDYDGIVSPAYSVFEFNLGIPRYYHYLFRTEMFIAEFKRNSTGVIESRLRLYDDEFGCIFSHLPPSSEQSQIVEFLDRKTALIDRLIAAKERRIELLKEQRTALINHAVTKGLDPNVKMKDSGIEWIGEIPEHWVITKLGFYTTKIGAGSTPSGGSEVYLDTGIPFIRSQNVLFSGLNLEGVAFIDQSTHESMSGTIVRQWDVLLNITGGSIGRCCVVESDIEMNVNQHVSIIRTVDKLNRFYLNYFLQSEIGQSQVRFNLTGGNREGLTIEGIRNFFLAFPENVEQQQIVTYLNAETQKIDSLMSLEQKKINLLKEYRQALISEAVTGKIKVTKE